MKTILLKVTEFPGRKSGRFTYEAIMDGTVIYKTVTDRTYVAIYLGRDPRNVNNVQRFGRFDLLNRATFTSEGILARVDFQEASPVPQEDPQPKNYQVSEWTSGDPIEITPDRYLEAMKFKSRYPTCLVWGTVDVNGKAVAVRTSSFPPYQPSPEELAHEAELEKESKLMKLADQMVDLMIATGLDWEGLNPLFTGIVNKKLIERLKEQTEKA